MGRPYPHQKEKGTGDGAGGGAQCFRLVFSAQIRCWSLKRHSVSFEIKNNNNNKKWMVCMRIRRHDEVIRWEDKGIS